LTVALGLGLGVLLLGCGGTSDSSSVDAIEKARAEATFPILWLGPDYRGNHVHDLVVGIPPAEPGHVFMAYGVCTPIDTGDQGSVCNPPYQLQEQDACDGFAIAGHPKLHRGPGHAITYHEGGGIVILSGRTYVKIFGDQSAEAARALRPIGSDELHGPQSAPLSDAIGGAGCQRRSNH
jgi:hypothetical protein